MTGSWANAYVRIRGILHIISPRGGTVCGMEIVGDDFVLFPEDDDRCQVCTGIWGEYRRAAKRLKRPDG